MMMIVIAADEFLKAHAFAPPTARHAPCMKILLVVVVVVAVFVGKSSSSSGNNTSLLIIFFSSFGCSVPFLFDLNLSVNGGEEEEASRHYVPDMVLAYADA